MPGKKYPAEQRERALQMVMDRLADYPTPYACAKALGPKLGVRVETLRKWILQAQIDEGERLGPTTEELEEIRRLKAEVRDLREANEILETPTVFFVRKLCATRRDVDREVVRDHFRWTVAAA